MRFTCRVVKIWKDGISFYSTKKDLMLEKKRQKKIGYFDPSVKVFELNKKYEAKTFPEIMSKLKSDCVLFFKTKKGKNVRSKNNAKL